MVVASNQTGDRASFGPPALAVFQGQLFMAWRGAGTDDNLWWATYDGNPNLQWSAQHPLTDRGSTEGPSLGVYQNQLFMVWRGVEGDENLYWATYDPSDPRGWTDQHALTDRASLGTPSLGAFQDQFFMVWRGILGDESLYWATRDPTDPRGWTDQHPLTDRGSTATPTLVAFQDKLYMIWIRVRGIDETDDRLFWATYEPNDPRGWTDQNLLQRVSSDQSSIVTLGSVNQPSLAVFNNSVSIASAGLQLQASGTGDSEPLGPSDNNLPQGPDLDDPDLPTAPEPKGLFYATFDGNIPGLPVVLFTDRASEAHIAQAVYLDIPLSLRTVMVKHGFDPSKGYKEFIKETFPASVGVRLVPMRALVGF